MNVHIQHQNVILWKIISIRSYIIWNICGGQWSLIFIGEFSDVARCRKLEYKNLYDIVIIENVQKWEKLKERNDPKNI